MNLINENLKLKIISGKPILLEKINCFFIHRTIEEIIDFGLEDFYRVIQLFELSDKELEKSFEFPMDNFFYLLLNLNNHTQISSLIEKGFFFFIGLENIQVNLEERKIIGSYNNLEGIEVNQEGFKEIIKYIDIIYEGNKLQEEEDDDSNLSEAERRMKEKFKKAKLAREKAKAKKEGTTQFSDLIGGFWSKSNMSWEDVLHLPYYTFYFLLERLKITDNYETQLRCMLAGADMKDKPLHHWLQGQLNDEE